MSKAIGPASWGDFMSPTLYYESGEPPELLTDVIQREIISHCGDRVPTSIRHFLVRDRPRTRVKLTGRRSALLFGPPGTSKTSLVRTVAERLEWPFLEITPSHFLRRGLEQIYEEANTIFDELMDLSGVVILFDEMDALVQSRSAGVQLDVARQFLTTSMLPKLARLHSAGQVVFFFATNHRREFDPAIVRPGRFDLLLCMGPPLWKEKRKGLAKWIGPTDSDAKKCKSLVEQWVNKNAEVQGMLDLFTYGEMKELFDFLRRRCASKEISLRNYLEEDKSRGFEGLERTVRDWYEKTITLRPGSESRIEYDQFDRKASRIQ